MTRNASSGENSISRLLEDIIGARTDAVTQDGGTKNLLNSILVVSTDYDYFILDEEGRLKALIAQKCRNEGRSNIPELTHATEEKALDVFMHSPFDAVFMFNPPGKVGVTNLASAMKEAKDVPVVLIGRNDWDMFDMVTTQALGPVDWIFTWSGDGKIFLDIIQFLEDTDAAMEPGSTHPVVLIGDSHPQHYSRFLYETHGVISEHMDALMPQYLSHTQRLERFERRHRVLLATAPEALLTLYRQHAASVVCIVIDPDIGAWGDIQIFLDGLRAERPELPVALITGTPKDDFRCMDINSPNLISELRGFVAESIGSAMLVFRDASGREMAVVHDIRELESTLWSLPADVFKSYMEGGEIAKWLKVIMEDELSSRISELAAVVKEPEELRKRSIAAVAEHKTAPRRGVITTYSRGEDSHSRFSRIGKGAMGGKARGLAFADKLITTYLKDDMMPRINVRIPRTVVLCSDIFEGFLEENNLVPEELEHQTDERIAQKFMEGDLPAPVLGDLRSFIRGTKAPIVVRSSSLLEDALHHPFAGVYASLLLPNESWDTDIRFQELCASIKYVFASVFFQKARTYMASLQDVKEDEKMAVVVQELVGSKHGSMFYPTISGVAKSYDYYPSGKCKAVDGVVNIALGLGKEVVDGGTAYRFCPLHPKYPKHGTLDNLLEHSQKDFFAVDLNSYVNIVQRNEDSTIQKFPISAAEPHGSLDSTASTYVHDEGRIYPGIGRDGIRVLDFAPILQLEEYPVSKLLYALLRMNEMAVGSPVEIEFAIDIPPGNAGNARFYLLQVRSMRSTGTDIEIDLGTHSPEDTFCKAAHAMGNGVISDIRDIVFIKRENYDISQNQAIIPQIRAINGKLLKSRTPYILVGPGRWGSTDPWLGIPVNWSDIAGARLIVETPIEERPVDPSQGSHFFHNMVAARTGYLTVIPGTDSSVDWDWLGNIPPVEESENVRHVRLSEPVEIRIDGGRGQGVILKRVIEAKDGELDDR